MAHLLRDFRKTAPGTRASGSLMVDPRVFESCVGTYRLVPSNCGTYCIESQVDGTRDRMWLIATCR